MWKKYVLSAYLKASSPPRPPFLYIHCAQRATTTEQNDDARIRLEKNERASEREKKI